MIGEGYNNFYGFLRDHHSQSVFECSLYWMHSDFIRLWIKQDNPERFVSNHEAEGLEPGSSTLPNDMAECNGSASYF